MKYKYITTSILVSAMLLTETVLFCVNALPLHAQQWCGKANSRREGCPVVQVKDDGGYVPPNYGGSDSSHGLAQTITEAQAKRLWARARNECKLSLCEMRTIFAEFKVELTKGG
ncbi:MAG: hypothetical protein V7K21_19330 [Nostoc sp.]|uniref:hypothetical protein n=1 Tax=Nostoc sp. TaxID=1180 RepID=UPI002FFB35D5